MPYKCLPLCIHRRLQRAYLTGFLDKQIDKISPELRKTNLSATNSFYF